MSTSIHEERDVQGGMKVTYAHVYFDGDSEDHATSFLKEMGDSVTVDVKKFLGNSQDSTDTATWPTDLDNTLRTHITFTNIKDKDNFRKLFETLTCQVE